LVRYDGCARLANNTGHVFRSVYSFVRSFKLFRSLAEHVPLPAPWEPAEVLRNMPALKFYHDLSSEVHTFNLAWGPCWDPAWSQVVKIFLIYEFYSENAKTILQQPYQILHFYFGLQKRYVQKPFC